MKISSILQITGGIAIAAIGLYIFQKDVDLNDIVKNAKLTEWWVILSVILLSPLSLWFRALRWKYMLPEKASANKNGLFGICVLGFAVNNILPARIGEAVRAVLLWKRNKFTIAESVGALILERIIDSTLYLSFLFIPILTMKKLGNMSLYGYISLILFSMVLIGFVFYSLCPSFTRRISEKIILFAPRKMHAKLLKTENEIISNIDWVFSIKKVLVIVVLSYMILFSYAGMIWLLGLRIGGIGLNESMFGVAFAAIGAAIPLSPGYVGTLHAVLKKGLDLVGVSKENAAVVTVLYHAIGYIVVTIMGAVFFFTMKIKVNELEKAKEDIKN